MANIFDDDIAMGEESPEITVDPGTVVSVNSNGPFHVLVENGTDGFVRGLSVEDLPFVASWIATSTTIKLQAPHRDLHASVYDNS